jgi:hypothetical protein
VNRSRLVLCPLAVLALIATTRPAQASQDRDRQADSLVDKLGNECRVSVMARAPRSRPGCGPAKEAVARLGARAVPSLRAHVLAIVESEAAASAAANQAANPAPMFRRTNEASVFAGMLGHLARIDAKASPTAVAALIALLESPAVQGSKNYVFETVSYNLQNATQATLPQVEGTRNDPVVRRTIAAQWRNWWMERQGQDRRAFAVPPANAMLN